MFEYQICNSEECPGPYEDFQAQQCAKRNSYCIHKNTKHSWIPYEPEDGEWTSLPTPFMFLDVCQRCVLSVLNLTGKPQGQ